MSAQPPETFLFDLDGTLIDSIELIFASYRHAFRVHCELEIEDEVLLAGLGTPLSAQLGPYCDDEPTLAAMIATYREYNDRHHDQSVTPYPGALEAIVGLVERGHPLGVVTSKRRSAVLRGLEVCGFDASWFGVLVCSDDLDVHKPDPGPVLHALEILGASPESTLFAGDSPHDLESGRRAGVRTAAATWGPFPRAALEAQRPDLWLDEPRALLRLAGGPLREGT